jgi:hypothetical protein
MFDIPNLSIELIEYYWNRARLCAESVWLAYVTECGLGQARLDQEWLRQWIKEAREAGLVYNGVYDEFTLLKL